MYSKTIIINLIAGPCSGKSTISAELFSRLKKMGIQCELVTEYIKERIYEENQTIIKNQIVLFAMEHYRLDNKLDKVDVIVHDGSLINNLIYDESNNKDLHDFVIKEYNKYNNIDFFLKRGTIGYENYGRIHNQEEAKELDSKIKEAYIKNNIPFIEIESRDAVDKIIPILLKKLNNEL